MDALDALIRDLEKAKKHIEAEHKKATIESANIARDSIRSLTPRKTGKLQRSIDSNVKSKEVAQVGSDLDYAIHVEKGHMQYERYVPAIGKKIKTKFIKGSHMFENGMNKAEPLIDMRVKELMDNLKIFE